MNWRSLNQLYFFSLSTEDERTVFGHIGRMLMSSLYTLEEIEGGILVQIGGANLTIHTLLDEANSARGIKIKWDADPVYRFEDCIDFGMVNIWIRS